MLSAFILEVFNLERILKLRDVYGVARDLLENYVERQEVDPVIVESLGRDKHVVVYGSSKQGKTTLRKHCLNEEDCIVVSCVNTMGISELNGAILKAAGYQVVQTQTRTVGGNLKYGVQFKGEGKVPFVAKVEGGGALEKENNHEDTTEYAALELDLSDVNDIISALKSIEFNKFIVLEDFHYLPVDTQRDFSFSLKSYHENSSICFIVVGVWREKNRLIYYNGDLTNRVASIDVDMWSEHSLREVLRAGEPLLNIKFDDEVADQLVAESSNTVSLLQEGCYRICERERIFETQPKLVEVGKGVDVRSLMRDVVNDQAGRYMAFITNFAEGFQPTEYDMYRWIMYVILTVDHEDLSVGIRRNVFWRLIKESHPVGANLNEGNITQALQSSASLQVTKNIRPIIVDYDQTTRVMNVVDRSFLIWLALQDRSELMGEIGLS